MELWQFLGHSYIHGVKKFLNYLQNTIQTSNSIYFKKHMNYRNKITNTKIVKELQLYTMQSVESALWNYRTRKVACLQKNLLAWKTGRDFLSSVVPASREYHKQKGIDLKKPHKVQAQEKGKTFGLSLPVNVDEGKKMPRCLVNHCNWQHFYHLQSKIKLCFTWFYSKERK